MAGIVLPRWCQHGAEMQAVPLAAFQQMDVAQGWDVDGVQQVAQQDHVAGHVFDPAFAERRAGGVDHVRDRACLRDGGLAGVQAGEICPDIADIPGRWDGRRVAAETHGAPAGRAGDQFRQAGRRGPGGAGNQRGIVRHALTSLAFSILRIGGSC